MHCSTAGKKLYLLLKWLQVDTKSGKALDLYGLTRPEGLCLKSALAVVKVDQDVIDLGFELLHGWVVR